MKLSSTQKLVASVIILALFGWGVKAVVNKYPVQKTVAPSSQNTISYVGKDGSDAMTLLKSTAKVETQSSGDLGEFVNSINGVKPADNEYWSFYVNGQPSQVGASQYQTKSSDLIEWKLDTFNNE